MLQGVPTQLALYSHNNKCDITEMKTLVNVVVNTIRTQIHEWEPQLRMHIGHFQLPVERLHYPLQFPATPTLYIIHYCYCY